MYKTARVVSRPPSWSHRGADIVDCTIVVVSLHVDEQLYQAIWLLDYWIGCSDGPKLRYLAKNVKISKFFYVPDEYFFKKNIQKHFKSGFLYVLDDSEMIWEKNIFSIFRTKFFDFGSIWRLHRMFNRYILLVVLSLPIDEQLCQRILSLHYWFGCSDSPKLPITSKNVVFAIWSHFWAWPLRATFWISIFKLS